jgi:BlaR1 peptidase M56
LTEPALSPVLQQGCQQEAERLAVRRLPLLHVSSRVDGPFLAGILRPTIVLPARADAIYDRTELGLILAHELAHLKRHDLLWNWLLVAVRSIFFFHPFVWVVKKCWSESQEAACDELVIQREVASPSDYGRLLLKLSTRSPRNSERTFATAGVLGAYRNLERRILAMSYVRSISRARLTTAACVAIAIGAAGIVPWQLTAQEVKNEEDQKLLASWDKMTDEQAVVATSNHVAAIMAAVHNYADAHDNTFPPIAIPNPNIPEVKQLSGLVLLLPYLGEKPSYISAEDWPRYRDLNGFGVDDDTMRKAKEVYGKINLQKAWDDPDNQEAARSAIPIFLAPKSAPIRDQRGFALSHFAFIRGYPGKDDGAFDKVGVGVRDITDGTVMTLAVGQIHSDLGPWLAAGPSTARYAYPPEGSQGNPSFGSQFKQGWFAATGDASTWFVDAQRANGKGLQLLVQRNDRTPVSVDDYLYRVRPEPELKKLMSFLKKEN